MYLGWHTFIWLALKIALRRKKKNPPPASDNSFADITQHSCEWEAPCAGKEREAEAVALAPTKPPPERLSPVLLAAPPAPRPAYSAPPLRPFAGRGVPRSVCAWPRGKRNHGVQRRGQQRRQRVGGRERERQEGASAPQLGDHSLADLLQHHHDCRVSGVLQVEPVVGRKRNFSFSPSQVKRLPL